MIRTSDTILGPTRGTLQQALAAATMPLTRAYMTEVFRLAPLVDIDASIVIAQWHLETDGGKSPRWIFNGNPAGLGVESDEDADPAMFTGAQAARVHLWALSVACDGDSAMALSLLPSSAQAFVLRWELKYRDSNCPTVATIDDLNIRYVDKSGEPQATWAWDADYQNKLVQRGALIFGNVPDQGGSDPVAPFSTQVPGLPGGPLQTTYPIRFNLIPLGNRFQRPGTKAHTPRVDVTHGTGNPSNPSAMAEAQYFVNGAEGRQASVHACIDDKEVVIVVPLDEVTWQAADGGGPGNMNGNSSEMMEADVIWDNVARRNKLIAITADFKGRTAARLGITVPKKHYDYNAGSADRHHCPDKLMTTGLWDSMYVPLWQAARTDELNRMNGTPTPPPGPTYTAPSLPPWFNAVLKDDFPENQDLNGQRFLICKKRLYVKKATVQRATASLKGGRSGPDLAAGVALDILGIFKSGSSTKYVMAAGSTKDKIAKGARIKMADLDELISITER